MTRERKRYGEAGEERAARFLAGRGYRILERNYRAPQGEIDLIALHRGELVFIEVKTRSNDAYGRPELAVDPRKQRRMALAALGYLKSRKMHQVPCRFDVVAISAFTEGEVEIIEHAFAMDRTRL